MTDDARRQFGLATGITVFVMLIFAALAALFIFIGVSPGFTATVVDGGSPDVIEDVTVQDVDTLKLHLQGTLDTSVREAYVVDGDGGTRPVADVRPGQPAVAVGLGGFKTFKTGQRYKVVLLDSRGDVVDWALVEVTVADG